MNSDYPRAAGNDVSAITVTTGVVIRTEDEIGCTLPAGTYFFPIPASRSGLVSLHMKWSAALAAVMTIESSNLREFDSPFGSSDDPDITIISTTAGDWMLQNPPSAYVPIVGTSNTVVAMTLTAGGAAAGGAFLDLGNIGGRRQRLKVVVSTAGILRVSPWGKLA